MSYREDYWAEAVGEALCSIGKFDLVTSEELNEIGKALAISSENESMAFGWDVASANLSASRQREEDDLRNELRRERNKVTCRECNGTGTFVVNGPYHSASGQCHKCRGAGRHDP